MNTQRQRARHSRLAQILGALIGLMLTLIVLGMLTIAAVAIWSRVFQMVA